MDRGKKIILLMMIVIVIIIMITGVLLFINKNKTIQEDNPETLAFENLEKVSNKDLFYKVNNNINKYFDYIDSKNNIAAQSISNGGIQLKRNYNTIQFQTQEMYVLDRISNITVYAYGVIRSNSIEDEYYLIINLDYQNNTFSIENSSIEEYVNATNNKVDNKYKQDILIQKNEYNEIQNDSITDFEILKLYFEDYKYKAINNVEKAFKLLDEQYSKLKFNNDINKYKEYINKNIEKLSDANIVKHGITKNGQYVEYIAIDNYNSYYKIKETGVNEYTIVLDNYTIPTEKLNESYNNLSINEKIASNIDKIFKLINEKDYSTLYSYINQEYKQKYFKTIEEFETYINQNFFDNNIVGSMNIQQEGNVYIVKVPYKESLSSAAESREKNFIIKLKEGTDFEMSFNVE